MLRQRERWLLGSFPAKVPLLILLDAREQRQIGQERLVPEPILVLRLDINVRDNRHRLTCAELRSTGGRRAARWESEGALPARGREASFACC